MFSSRCSAGSARRTSFRRRTSGSSGPSSARRFTSYFSESRYSSEPGAHRHVLERLEAGVDAVARRERRGQHEPRLERGRPAELQVLVQDVGRVHERVRPIELGQASSSRMNSCELRLRVLPREVRVALREAELRERRHHRRPRERLREEDHLRMLPRAPRAISHSQNGDRLRVRVVDAEDRDAALDPAEDDVEQRLPQPLASPPSRS